jgi:putative nucleotidyltransferase with HDIG domain
MIKRVPVSALRPGMFLHKTGGSWLDHPFWRSAFLLADADIRSLREHGVTEVWIDAGKGLDVSGGTTVEQARQEAEDELFRAATAPMPMLDLPPAHAGAPAEAARAAKICERSREAVARLFSDARLGRAVEADAFLPLVQEISESVTRDEAALISLVRIKTSDDYTYLHSVAVCALMVALARQLGFNEEQARRAGLAGLLHDVGKARIPTDILNKPGKLTDQEFAIMRNHPMRGHAILARGGGIDPLALDVCLHHHEKMDGTGYPAKLAGDRISLLSRMGAVCDVYDAVTSHRPYKRPWDPADALRQMAQWHGHFDTLVFQAFVKTVGIYPVGSLLRLASGKLAVVTGQSTTNLLLPRLRVIHCAERREPVKPYPLDLSELGHGDAVVGIESADAWNLGPLDRHWLGAEVPA